MEDNNLGTVVAVVRAFRYINDAAPCLVDPRAVILRVVTFFFQINDKERVAAALENPNLRKTVDECINHQEN